MLFCAIVMACHSYIEIDLIYYFFEQIVQLKKNTSCIVLEPQFIART